jgi:hypothetical protein
VKKYSAGIAVAEYKRQDKEFAGLTKQARFERVLFQPRLGASSNGEGKI